MTNVLYIPYIFTTHGTRPRGRHNKPLPRLRFAICAPRKADLLRVRTLSSRSLLPRLHLLVQKPRRVSYSDPPITRPSGRPHPGPRAPTNYPLSRPPMPSRHPPDRTRQPSHLLSNLFPSPPGTLSFEPSPLVGPRRCYLFVFLDQRLQLGFVYWAGLELGARSRSVLPLSQPFVWRTIKSGHKTCVVSIKVLQH